MSLIAARGALLQPAAKPAPASNPPTSTAAKAAKKRPGRPPKAAKKQAKRAASVCDEESAEDDESDEDSSDEADMQLDSDNTDEGAHETPQKFRVKPRSKAAGVANTEGPPGRRSGRPRRPPTRWAPGTTRVHTLHPASSAACIKCAGLYSMVWQLRSLLEFAHLIWVYTCGHRQLYAC